MSHPTRHIIHADFDAFYAAVEQLDRPELRGKPVVVGGSPESRGVVASASYEAREYGVRSAMPMRTALAICPQAVRVASNFGRYRDVSRKAMTIFAEITPLVEPLSLDEAYLDVSAEVVGGHPVRGIALQVKRRVLSRLGLTISLGVATSKSVAKIASDFQKPDGLTIVPPGEERAFLAPLEVGRLWGVGPKTAERLHDYGVRTIGQLATLPEEWFTERFGRTGGRMRSLAMGVDDSEVVVERETKSISAETTLAQDTGDPEALKELVNRLSLNVAQALSRKSLRGRTVKLKLRLSDFTTFTRQNTLPERVESSAEIAEAATALLEAELSGRRQFRLVGVGVSGFDDVPGRQADKHVQLILAGFER